MSINYFLPIPVILPAVSRVKKYLYYSDFLNWNDEWPVSGYKKRLQQGEHLGERMIHAFTEVFNEGP